MFEAQIPREGRTLRGHTSSGSDLHDACPHNIFRESQNTDFSLLEFATFLNLHDIWHQSWGKVSGFVILRKRLDYIFRLISLTLHPPLHTGTFTLGTLKVQHP